MAFDLVRGKQDGKDWSCGIEEMGSFLTPTSVLNKIDDMRYDVRQLGASIGGGIYALAGAFAFLAFAGVYRGVRERKVA
jgi:hypothetical protein